MQLFQKPENKEKISTLRKAYQIFINIVEVFCENPSHPTHELNDAYLKCAFRGRTAPIHSILLSQNLVSGLGNIYATEALFDAGIKPTKPCGKISAEKLALLTSSIYRVVSDSIEKRGYSMNTYVDALGQKGRSQLFSRAYGKAGLPCPRCGTPFKRTVLSGRGVVFCSKCQK